MSSRKIELMSRYVQIYRELKMIEEEVGMNEPPQTDPSLQERIHAMVEGISLVSFIESVHHLDRINRETKDMRGDCMFHDDDKRSMYVVPDKGFYHCFACGAHGNVVELNAKWQGCSIKESLEELEARFALEGGYLAFRKTPNA